MEISQEIYFQSLGVYVQCMLYGNILANILLLTMGLEASMPCLTLDIAKGKLIAWLLPQLQKYNLPCHKNL